MGIQKIILNIILTIESFFLSFLKIKKNRITFISLESHHLTSDFQLIYNELDKQKYDVCLCLTHYHKNLFGQLKYFFNCLKQLYYIYTSHMIILNNNNYAVSEFKREGVIVLQTWHACGAIKKFGNVIDRKYAISNYDYVLSTSSFWKEAYSQAFDVPIDRVIPTGMPRNDELFNEEIKAKHRENLLNKYPHLKDKKIILYAPTFRGNIYKGFHSVTFDALQIIESLGDDYVILYKFHPLLGNLRLAKHERIINMNHEDTHQLFCIADYLISDYSSIVFDFMILEKPLLFFVPDLKDYLSDVGTFVNIHQLGCPICYDEDEIIHLIKKNKFSIEKIQKDKALFFDACDDQSTKRVVQLIDHILEKSS